MAKAYALLVVLILAVSPCSLARRAVKTIKSDDGGVIDCVDLYEQPAFKHPLLTNHTLQMEPSSRSMIESSTEPVKQPLMEKGSCPEGTVPIRRAQKPHGKTFGRKGLLSNHGRILAENSHLEGTGVSFIDRAGNWLGATGELNVWSIDVERNDFSSSSVRIWSGKSPGSFLEAGYMVNSQLYGDTQPHLYASWTADSAESTGCFNLLCPGFVQVDKQIGLGMQITPVSQYDGPQVSIVISILKEADKWWLVKDNVKVGYWPLSIVPDLDFMKEAVWGGWVFNTRNDGKHTTTQMGSGHFPDEGENKSAYIKKAQILGQGGLQNPASVKTFATTGRCYDVKIVENDKTMLAISYGGPGGLNCA